MDLLTVCAWTVCAVIAVILFFWVLSSRIQPQGHVINNQAGGRGYNPQIQGQIKAQKINLGPNGSGNGRTQYNQPQGRTTKNQTPAEGNSTTQPQGYVANNQIGGDGYNPQLQGQINAEEIDLASGDMTSHSQNAEGLTFIKKWLSNMNEKQQ